MKQCILHLPKWFPNKFDNQNGIFIDKHICSVQDDYDQIVLSIYQDNSLSKNTQVQIEIKGSITYVKISFKPLGTPVLNVLRYGYLGMKFGLKYAKDTTLIHTHVMGRNVFMGWLIAKVKSLKHIHTEHWSLFLNTKQWNSKSWIYKRITRFLLGQIQTVLTVSEPLNKRLIEINPQINSEVVGNVISNNPYTGIEKHPIFTFIHISDLRDDIKNISGVIESFIKFQKQSHLPVQLNIIGDGEDRLKLEKKANNHVDIHFLGRQDNLQVYKNMNKSHVLILNSRMETFGMVVLEAFSCGIPVICAKNGVTEYFVDQSTGLIIEQYNNNALGAAMESMLINYEQYLPSVLKAKAKPFTEVVIGNKIKRIYKKYLHEE